MKELNRDVEEIADYLEAKQKDFDAVMQMSRDIIRSAGQTITLLHNNEREEAENRLGEMSSMVKKLQKIDGRFKYNTLQAYQEYVEAYVFHSIKIKGRIPPLSRLDVEHEAYLLGLMDVVGELKREILEYLRVGDIKKAEWYFDMMKRIYDSTRRLRFAEAVLSGFRKKQDVARIQIENAGSEILSFRNRR